MRDFERGRSRLRNLPYAGRAVYSIFLAFTLVALGLSAWLTHDMVGLDLSGLDGYYAGAPSDELEPPPEEPGFGPEIVLPDDVLEPAPAEPLSRRKLLEVTHFHLFSMPVYLLILSHLFMLSGAPRWSKVAFIGAATVGVALHAAAPWIAVGGGLFALVVFAGSGVLLAVGFGWMSAVPLWEMWAPQSERREDPKGTNG